MHCFSTVRGSWLAGGGHEGLRLTEAMLFTATRGTGN